MNMGYGRGVNLVASLRSRPLPAVRYYIVDCAPCIRYALKESV